MRKGLEDLTETKMSERLETAANKHKQFRGPFLEKPKVEIQRQKVLVNRLQKLLPFWIMIVTFSKKLMVANFKCWLITM